MEKLIIVKNIIERIRKAESTQANLYRKQK